MENESNNSKKVVFGEIGWEADAFSGDKKSGNNKDTFLRLEKGSNEVRLITKPHIYNIHRVKKDENNPKDFGQKVSCSAIHGSCVLCDAGDKPKSRWLLGVISRKTNSPKILDVSYTVFAAIRKLAQNTARWGDPTKYDLDIVVDPDGGAAGYYTVQPISKEPLSATDQQMRDNFDMDNLKRLCTPLTADAMQKRINKIKGIDAPVSAPTPVKVPAQVDVKGEDETLSADFPDYSSPSA